MRLRGGLVLIASVGVGVGFSLLASRGGPGVSPDSVVYLQGARALRSGVGYVVERGGSPIPIVHFPPVYSATLAAVGAVGKDSLSRALRLNIALEVALLLIVWWGLTRGVGAGFAATAIGLGFVATSPEVTDVGAWVLSEPLFFCLSTGALFLLANHLRRPRRALLVAASVLVAAAVLTRYAGVALLGAVPLSLLLWRRRSFRERAIDVTIHASIVALPILAWGAHVLGSRGASAGSGERSISLHPPTLDDWQAGAATLSHWIFPYAVPAVLGVLLVLTVTGFALAVTLRRLGANRTTSLEEGPSRQGQQPHALVFLVAAFGYLATVVFARSVVDAMVPFNGRMMAPAFIYFVVGTVAALSGAQVVDIRFKRVGAAIAILLIASQARHAYYNARDVDHLGYTGERYERMAPELEDVQATVAYSNATSFLRFHFGSPVRPLPYRYDPYSRSIDPDFESKVRGLCDRLARTQGTVLYLSAARHRSAWVPTLDELRRVGNLEVKAREEGWTLLVPGPCA